MMMNGMKDRRKARVAVCAILLIGFAGCGGVQQPIEEPAAAPPRAPTATATVLPLAEQAPIEAIKAFLSDRRAKPAILAAGGLLAAALLAVGLAKVLRGDPSGSRPENNGSVGSA